MLIYLLLGVAVFSLSFASSLSKHRIYLGCSFLLIFIFQAIRYNYGNDYLSYQDIFIDINNLGASILKQDSRFEFGWVVLNRLFKHLGFEFLIAFVSLVISLVYYKFIVFYVNPKHYWISVLLFYFDPNCLLISITAIRQSVAIAFVLLSWIYFDSEKHLKSFLCLLMAPFFHASAIIVLPVLLFIYLLRKVLDLSIFIKVIFILTYVSFFFIARYFFDSLQIVSILFETSNYSQYLSTETNNSFSIFNIVYYTLLLTIILKYSKHKLKKNNYLYFIAISGLLFIPFSLITPLISRFSYYFLPTLVILVPKILEKINPTILKKPWIVFILFVTFLRLFRFLTSETYSSGFYHYQTIFDKWI
jgi:transmembrane protein EpsG